MSKTYTSIDVNTDTFFSWLTLTNSMATDFADVITVAANTAGDVTSGNGFVNGVFGANTLVMTNMRGGSIETSGPLGVTSNVVFSGGQINATSNVYVTSSNVYAVSNNIVFASNASINAISVKANSTFTNVSVTGSAFVVTANSTLSNSTTVAGVLTVSNNASVSGDMTIATQTMISSNTASLSGTTAQLVDSFSGSTYRGGKYVLSAKDEGNSVYQMTEILLMHDGSSAYTTEYATLKYIANNLVSFSSNVSGSTVRLYATPTVASLTVKLSKTLNAV